jgi:hypothetical protein
MDFELEDEDEGDDLEIDLEDLAQNLVPPTEQAAPPLMPPPPPPRPNEDPDVVLVRTGEGRTVGQVASSVGIGSIMIGLASWLDRQTSEPAG